MEEKNCSNNSAFTGEFVFCLPEGYEEDVPLLVKNSGADAVDAYKSGKEVRVFATEEQLDSISFAGEQALIRARLPMGTREIKFAMFSECMSLVEAVIPDTVEVINKDAFYFCKALEKITLPESLKSVYENCFFFCEGLKELTFPDGTEDIDLEAIKHCDSLERITIPSSVRKIHEALFSGLPSLKEIRFTGSAEKWQEIFVPCRVPSKRISNINIVFDI